MHGPKTLKTKPVAFFFLALSVLFLSLNVNFQSDELCSFGSNADVIFSNDDINSVVTDVCTNYPGIQTQVMLNQFGFVQEHGNRCFLKKNHDAYARMGVDKVKIKGFQGQGIRIGLVDIGRVFEHSELRQRIKNTNQVIQPSLHSTQVASAAIGATVGVASHANILAKNIAHSETQIEVSSQNIYNQTRDILYKKPVVFEKLGIESLGKKKTPIIIQPNNIGINLLLFLDEKNSKYASSKFNYDINDLLFFLKNLRLHDSVLVISAGNQGQDMSLELQKSMKHGFVLSLNDKELAQKMLYVGAFDVQKNILASYSNYPGSLVELQKRFLVVSDNLSLASLDKKQLKDNIYGTSYAAPVAAGALAVLMQLDPSLSASEASNLLLQTADRNLPEYYKECSIQINTKISKVNCGELKYGSGLLNLDAAVNTLIDRKCSSHF